MELLNKIAITKLINIIQLARENYRKAIKSIGQIKNHQDYLDARDHISINYQYKILFAAKTLCKIAPNQEVAHDNLIYLIKSYYDDYHIRERAINALIAIMNQPLTKKLVIEFKQYLLPIKYKNSLRIKKDIDKKEILSGPLFDPSYDRCRKFCWHFREYYEIVWLCSKQMSYTEFYQIWHQKNLLIFYKRMWHKILFKIRIYR